MKETSARLLRLLSLLQMRRDWAGGDLAERLEVDVRTVRRDVDRLRGLGYPVHSTTGTAGGYRLGAGAALPPLLLDDEEAVAVAISLRTAAVGTVEGIEETSVRALLKLEQVLPSHLRRRVQALQSATVSLSPSGPTVDPETLTTIAAACRDHERLRFTYRSHADTSSVRMVEPHRLVHTPRRWYLVAWDVDRADWRTFRVDRIEGAPSGRGRFVPREAPAEDVGAYVAQGVASAPYRYQARVLLHAPAEAVSRRLSPTAGRVEAVGSERCVLHAGSNALEEIAVYVGVLGVEFEVLDPPELVDHLRELSERLGRAVRR
ncbi:YafY family transcriptional regulator [Nonomuraea sp. NBC_01738]|uniref:helix-turn-helix transcriptional regulator n=1 Tax=Nonomuraea sp. NBC_01738 TaxID=2976003 RepID=UPI002E0EF704|nr:YafY family transcriptional regulator [Nonomuraea sp. NBC_01738]